MRVPYVRRYCETILDQPQGAPRMAALQALQRDLRAVRCPVLVLNGSLDRPVPAGPHVRASSRP